MTSAQLIADLPVFLAATIVVDELLGARIASCRTTAAAVHRGSIDFVDEEPSETAAFFVGPWLADSMGLGIYPDDALASERIRARAALAELAGELHTQQAAVAPEIGLILTRILVTHRSVIAGVAGELHRNRFITGAAVRRRLAAAGNFNPRSILMRLREHAFATPYERKRVAVTRATWPGLEGKLWIRSLNALENEQYLDTVRKSRTDRNVCLAAEVTALVTVDEQGQPVFDADDVAKLAQGDPWPVNAIFESFLEMRNAEDDAAKNA